MGNAKVLIDFSTGKYTDLGLSKKASTIGGKMKGNRHFATPEPPIETLETANSVYTESVSKVENGSKEDTVNKNKLRAALIIILKNLAQYVQTTSNGDEGIMLSSGFDVNKKPSVVGQLEKPESLKVQPGPNKGSMELTCSVVEFANFYEFEYMEITPEGNGIWILRTSTKRKLVIDGLNSGKEYIFRAAGAGTYPIRVWSEDVKSFVL